MNSMEPAPLVRPVIVADDDLVMRGILRSLLAGVGQDVFLAATGDEAITLASRTHAKLIILDLGMPGLNGLMACARIRALPAHESTPIVILTAHNGSKPRLAAAQVGATLFVPKPFRPAELVATLAPFLDLNVSTQEAVARGARRATEIATQTPERDQPNAPHLPRPSDLLEKGRVLLNVYR